jgi:hypothetical protein
MLTVVAAKNSAQDGALFLLENKNQQYLEFACLAMGEPAKTFPTMPLEFCFKRKGF